MEKDMIYHLTGKHLSFLLVALVLQPNSVYLTSDTFAIVGLLPINSTFISESGNLARMVDGLTQQFNESVGVQLRDGCNQKGVAMQAMLEIFGQPDNFTAIIGPGSKEAIQDVNQFLETIPDKVLHIVHNPLFTSKNYLQNTAPSVSIVVDVIVDLMVRIEWNYVAIVRDSTEFSRLSCELLLKKAAENRICIGLVEETNLNEDIIFDNIMDANIDGILVLGSEDTIRTIFRRIKNKNTEYKNLHFIFSSNENLRTQNDELPDQSLQVLWGHLYNKTTGFKYIYESANMAFTWFKICLSSPECRPVRHQELFNGTLNIFQKVKGKQIQVGTYAKELVLNSGGIRIEKAFCKKECEKCRLLDRVPNSYIIKPGTQYIITLLPIHNAGKDGPFSCSETIKLIDSVDLIEAARFAIKTSVRPDFGLIIVDTCVNPLVATEQLIGINGSYVIGVIGGYYSLTTIPAAEILTRLQIPHISYGAESHVLSDRGRFPYFQTTSVSLDRTTETIILLCKRMGWKAINVIYNNEAYGISGHSLLVKYAQIHGICIVNHIKVELREVKFHKYLNQLRKTSNVKVVINFLIQSIKWFSVLNEDLVENEFLFIMAYKLRDGEIKKLKKEHFKSYMVIGYKKLMNKEFIDYYTSLKEPDIRINPWAKEFIEKNYKCYFKGSFNNDEKIKKTCEYQLKMDSVSEYHDLLIKGIYALINGTEAFNKSKNEDLKKITMEIRKTRFNISGKEQRLFDDDGISQIQLFTLDRVVEADSNVLYDTFAEFKNGNWYSDDWDELSITSKCESDDFCPACPVEDETVYEIFTVLDAILAVVIAVLIGFIIWKKRIDLRKCLKFN